MESARPADLPALDTQREREDISKAFWQRLTPGDVHIEWLREDRWADLAEAIRSHPWHVLHIMSHGGFDPKGLIRAVWTNYRAGHLVQGGSTITQQTVKIVFLSQERTLSRKLQELLAAPSVSRGSAKRRRARDDAA